MHVKVTGKVRKAMAKAMRPPKTTPMANYVRNCTIEWSRQEMETERPHRPSGRKRPDKIGAVKPHVNTKTHDNADQKNHERNPISRILFLKAVLSNWAITEATVP